MKKSFDPHLPSKIEKVFDYLDSCGFDKNAKVAFLFTTLKFALYPELSGQVREVVPEATIQSWRAKTRIPQTREYLEILDFLDRKRIDGEEIKLGTIEALAERREVKKKSVRG